MRDQILTLSKAIGFAWLVVAACSGKASTGDEANGGGANDVGGESAAGERSHEASPVDTMSIMVRLNLIFH